MMASSTDIDETPQTCHLCQKVLGSRASCRRHLRMKHGVDTTSLRRDDKRFYSCVHSECVAGKLRFVSISDYRAHLALRHRVHGITEPVLLVFDSFEEVQVWKTEQERRDVAKFICSRGVRHSASASVWRYDCNRSGAHKSKSTGLRRLKAQGSCKTGHRCPASMVVTRKDDRFHVTYHATHYGHEKTLCHMGLSSADRRSIADQLSRGIPPEKILRDVRLSMSGRFDRSHLLTLKDLRNIQLAYRIGREGQAGTLEQGVEQQLLPEGGPGEPEYAAECERKESSDPLTAWVDVLHSQLGDNSPVLLYHNPPGSPLSPFTRPGLASIALVPPEPFILVLMSPLQRRMYKLFGADRVCIDSVEPAGGGAVALTTLLVVDEYEEGFPVAFMLSSTLNAEAFGVFYGAVRGAVGEALATPDCFVSDDAPDAYTPWCDITFAATAKRTHYTQNVDRAWRGRGVGGAMREPGGRRQAVLRAFRGCHLELGNIRRRHLDGSAAHEVAALEVSGNTARRGLCDSERGPTMSSEEPLMECADTVTSSGVTTMTLAIGVVELSGCIEAVFSLLLDKQFGRLAKLHKGQPRARAPEGVEGHAEGVALAPHCMALGEGRWQVPSSPLGAPLSTLGAQACIVRLGGGGQEGFYQGQQGGCHQGQWCSETCMRSCRLCRCCPAMSCCSCGDYQAGAKLCKHIHAAAINRLSAGGGGVSALGGEASGEGTEEIRLYLSALRAEFHQGAPLSGVGVDAVRGLASEVAAALVHRDLDAETQTAITSHLNAVKGLLATEGGSRAPGGGAGIRSAKRAKLATQRRAAVVGVKREECELGGIWGEEGDLTLQEVLAEDQEHMASLLDGGPRTGLCCTEAETVAEVDECMALLRRQFPLVAGLEPTSLIGSAEATTGADGRQVVQIHYTGTPGHWVTSTRARGEVAVTIYDSLLSLDGQGRPLGSAALQLQLSQIYRTSERELGVWYASLPPCPSLDSALCSIARATDLCHSSRPPPLAYHPTSLRPHLDSCLARVSLTLFPVQGGGGSRGGRVRKLYAGVAVYCYCRRAGNECMVDCVACLESFHCECVAYSGGDFRCTGCSGSDSVASQSVCRL